MFDDFSRPIGQAVEVEVEGVVAGEHQVTRGCDPTVVEIYDIKKI